MPSSLRPLARPLARPAVLALALTAGLAGCGSNALDSSTAKKLRGLSSLYASLAVSRNGAGPKSEKELKEYVRAAPHQSLPLDIDPANREAVFVSDRDQQPFVIVPGASIRGMTGTEAPLVAYEQTGVGGKRLVAYANSKVEEVSDDRLQELLGPPKP